MTVFTSPETALCEIPDALKFRARWVLWKFESRDGKPPTKVPIQIDGRPASSTDPSTWTTWEHACANAGRVGVEGVGFVLGAGIVGVDLDHVRDRETGALAPWAQRVLDTLDTYCELSPSGTGVHAFFFGEKPAGTRCNIRFPDGTAAELYDHGRYFTVTANRLGGRPDLRFVSPYVLTQVYDSLLARLPPKPRAAPVRSVVLAPAALDDTALLEKMFASRNGPLLARLWHGDISSFGSQSEADYRLISALVFWTHKDAARVDALFRCSALMRPKWDSARAQGTYGAMTIASAIARCTATFGDA